jgi:hypothetical protein
MKKALAAVERAMDLEMPLTSGRHRSKLDLVREVLAAKAMNIHQINDAIREAGFMFYAQNPAGAIRALLYGHRDLFVSDRRGRFSLKTASHATVAEH